MPGRQRTRRSEDQADISAYRNPRPRRPPLQAPPAPRPARRGRRRSHFANGASGALKADPRRSILRVSLCSAGRDLRSIEAGDCNATAAASPPPPRPRHPPPPRPVSARAASAAPPFRWPWARPLPGRQRRRSRLLRVVLWLRTLLASCPWLLPVERPSAPPRAARRRPRGRSWPSPSSTASWHLRRRPSPTSAPALTGSDAPSRCVRDGSKARSKGSEVPQALFAPAFRRLPSWAFDGVSARSAASSCIELHVLGGFPPFGFSFCRVSFVAFWSCFVCCVFFLVHFFFSFPRLPLFPTTCTLFFLRVLAIR